MYLNRLDTQRLLGGGAVLPVDPVAISQVIGGAIGFVGGDILGWFGIATAGIPTLFFCRIRCRNCYRCYCFYNRWYLWRYKGTEYVMIIITKQPPSKSDGFCNG
jgi:hypothetical protein